MVEELQRYLAGEPLVYGLKRESVMRTSHRPAGVAAAPAREPALAISTRDDDAIYVLKGNDPEFRSKEPQNRRHDCTISGTLFTGHGSQPQGLPSQVAIGGVDMSARTGRPSSLRASLRLRSGQAVPQFIVRNGCLGDLASATRFHNSRTASGLSGSLRF